MLQSRHLFECHSREFENVNYIFSVFAVFGAFILSVVRAEGKLTQTFIFDLTLRDLQDTNDAELEQELDQYLNNLADEIIAEEQFQRDARAAGNR